MDEHIFESLSTEDAKHWPLRFIEAVPVGVDLQLVFPRFMHWLLTDPHGITKHANAKTRKIIEMLIAMYARRIDGIPFDREAAWAASVAADKSYIHRQANYLIALLQSHESKPLNTQPCPENIHELVKALNI